MANDFAYNGYTLEVVITILLVLTFVAILLRCYARVIITKAFELDDWLMVVSQVIFTLSCSFMLVGLHFGIGRHNYDLSTKNQIEALKYQVLTTFAYIVNMTSIKMSIAVFLLRIASKKPYIWTIWLSIVVVLIWSTIILFYDIFQCIPVQAQWDFTIPNARCITGPSFAAAVYSISVMTIVTDWLYALLPIPLIWGVKMNLKTKVTVAIILGLGICASLATIIRLKYIMVMEDLSDILYSGTPAMVWTVVEPGVAIIAASLFTIRPLLHFLNFSGFESNNLTTLSAQPLSLRRDVEPGNYNAGVEAENTNRNTYRGYRFSESLGDLKRSGNTSRDMESEEWILESGITRTVDVRLESMIDLREGKEWSCKKENN